ncbi:MAG TPA: hypothetical protein VKV18_15395 [Chthonomonas sp.]|uniref:hypothetical protein n=1 Tax=Chthonomonas sp. TaxID=2282153 RepID=UPI002B4AE214|nr:hypothetical protein [Chthonomonas sp.]HLI50054.1 hypothetical protein [Chthonomonas sp.]
MRRHTLRPRRHFYWSIPYLLLCGLVWGRLAAASPAALPPALPELPYWHRLYDACYGSDRVAYPKQIEAFLSQAEGYDRLMRLYNPPLYAHILFMEGKANEELHHYNDAKRCWQSYLNWHGSDMFGARYHLIADKYLLGKPIFADFVHYLLLRVALAVLPSVTLPLLWLLIWWRRFAPQWTRRDVLRLSVVALLLGLLGLFPTILEPICSLLIFGNFWVFVAIWQKDLVVACVEAILDFVLLVACILIIRRLGWMEAKRPTSTIEERLPTSLPDRLPTGRRRRLRPTARLFLAVSVALMLYGRGLSPYLHIPHNMLWWVRSPHFGFWSLSRAIILVFLNSFAIETLFRGTIYPFARQEGGVVFGILYCLLVELDWSSTLPNSSLTLFIVLLITLYEFTGTVRAGYLFRLVSGALTYFRPA